MYRKYVGKECCLNRSCIGERILGQVVKELCKFSNNDTNPNLDLNVPSGRPSIFYFEHWIKDHCGWVAKILGNYPAGMSMGWKVLGDARGKCKDTVPEWHKRNLVTLVPLFRRFCQKTTVYNHIMTCVLR